MPPSSTLQKRTLAVGAFLASKNQLLNIQLPTNKTLTRDFLLECLEGAIFWDSDWAAGDHYLDLPPEEAKGKMEYMGIDPEYFLAIPREPSPKELSAARQKLSHLIAAGT